MFKNFLCVIPRNKPAQAVFQLVYHFLNQHLPKTDSTIHDKIVYLWYIAMREFSITNDCNHQYYELFQVSIHLYLESFQTMPIQEEPKYHIYFGRIHASEDD